MDELLRQGLEVLSSKDPDIRPYLEGERKNQVAEGLERYINEIELFNAAYGLVGNSDRQELIIKHILDSLAPLGVLLRIIKTHTPRITNIADVGSGAGLPGIPLAIVLREHRFTLIERMGRRIGFLQNTLAVLGLDNVETEQRNVEEANPGRFDLVSFRAFRPLDAPMIKALFRLLKPTGILAAYKAREEKVAKEMRGIADLVGSWEGIDTPVPFLDEPRRIVLIKAPRIAGHEDLL